MLRIAIFVFLSLSLYAVNLEDFIELSLRNETNLIKENEILKANNEKDKALSAYFPSISLESAYNANNGDVFIDRAKESLYAVFSLSYIIYDGGKREAQFKGAKSMQNLALLNSQFTKQNTVYKACVLYFNYLSLEKIISAISLAAVLVFFFISYCALSKFTFIDIIYGVIIFVPSVLFMIFAPMFNYGGILMEVVCVVYAVIISFMVGKSISLLVSRKNMLETSYCMTCIKNKEALFGINYNLFAD